MSLKFCTLDVFTDHRFGGNPLAVFLDVPELPAEFMQSIAREFNLSETVFIVKPRDRHAVRRLRIFTPTRELPFAGHPTIGAAFALLEEGLAGVSGTSGSFLLEEEVGLVPINVRRQTDALWFVQLTAAKLPEEGPPAPPVEELARLLNIPESSILQDADFAQIYSCGVQCLFIPVRNRQVLGQVVIDPAVSRRIEAKLGPCQMYVFSYDPEREESDIRARMFVQEIGIVEDPATGSAATALAGYLAKRSWHRDGSLQWTIEQGFEMGRSSLLYLEADLADGSITAVRVGGNAVRMSEGQLTTFT
jgi:trans-2,3-dihydro-3-hydroxyanthranilate isomerase